VLARPASSFTDEHAGQSWGEPDDADGDSREQADAALRRAERVILEEADPPPESALPPL